MSAAPDVLIQTRHVFVRYLCDSICNPELPIDLQQKGRLLAHPVNTKVGSNTRDATAYTAAACCAYHSGL